MLKICSECKEEYEAWRDSQQWCSRECRAITDPPPKQKGQTFSSSARQLTEAEVAWLAGVVDGEGSIVFVKYTGSEKVKTVRLSVTNTNYPFLERIREVAGTGSIVNQRPATEKHAQSWYWQCYGANTKALCRQLLPWLIIKRDRAERALAL